MGTLSELWFADLPGTERTIAVTVEPETPLTPRRTAGQLDTGGAAVGEKRWNARPQP
ncbi:hypothetical protein GCM10010140_63510 [Streptosporangium pseudovulgare]|uniref:Uncharacterized protein n=1 Tax=Streptosporangium pseudovulgare TaxID=35765 RepID=A0ABQ2RE75_9ACTN|nr:hypothetical protein GCM10010140_63510 [Streptosporangium pseudovulgare]